MTSLAVTLSTLKTYMKFWGTTFKFWLCPWMKHKLYNKTRKLCFNQFAWHLTVALHETYTVSIIWIIIIDNTPLLVIFAYLGRRCFQTDKGIVQCLPYIKLTSHSWLLRPMWYHRRANHSAKPTGLVECPHKCNIANSNSKKYFTV